MKVNFEIKRVVEVKEETIEVEEEKREHSDNDYAQAHDDPYGCRGKSDGHGDWGGVQYPPSPSERESRQGTKGLIQRQLNLASCLSSTLTHVQYKPTLSSSPSLPFSYNNTLTLFSILLSFLPSDPNSSHHFQFSGLGLEPFSACSAILYSLLLAT